MRVTLILNGKTDFAFVNEGFSLYNQRIAHYSNYHVETLPDIKNTKSLSQNQVKEKEGQQLLKKIADGDYLVLLDENGKVHTSVSFARFIENKALITKNLVFVIGGAYGFSDEVLSRANEKISFSKMTFSHQIFRVIFAEQLYRAFTIIKGEKYHHE